MSTESSFTAALRCPDDGHLLEVHADQPVAFASCRHCDGLWFTREAMDKGGKPDLPPPGKRRRLSVAQTTERLCPQCSVKLDAETEEGMTIDVCSQCGGVWLDHGEYRAARRRSVRQRLERDVPSVRQSSSRIVRLIGRFIDDLEPLFEEPEEEFQPRKVIPKRRDR